VIDRAVGEVVAAAVAGAVADAAAGAGRGPASELICAWSEATRATALSYDIPLFIGIGALRLKACKKRAAAGSFVSSGSIVRSEWSLGE
jgi:hypothetical protein